LGGQLFLRHQNENEPLLLAASSNIHCAVAFTLVGGFGRVGADPEE
jgi:hypothetical protein